MFFVFFLLFLFSGIATLTGFILGVIGLSTSKKAMRNGGLITFGIGLITLLCTIYFSVQKAVQTVQEDFVEPFAALADSLNNFEYNTSITEDDRAFLLNETNVNEQFNFLRDASLKVKPDVNSSYFTYFGSNSFSRMPLIYPYAIHCWDSKNYGTLVNEEKVIDIKTTPGNEENIIFNVIEIQYNDRYIFMKTSNMQETTEGTVITWILYDMKTKKIKDFKSENDMFTFATKNGFKGERKLVNLWDYDSKF